ncbi:uncharacterized protein LOC127137785 [Lathyrus oleraceus]|uniref:uncharacterized protein LOC127137785 n=1 Tax=Pisum sativum TaxID=3888 RepID=UPI0021D34DA1|nr:uncharacterized protein LOC127137785 [Pisum sativum]
MVRPFDMINNINDRKELWKIGVKVHHKWKVSSTSKEHFEMAVIDKHVFFTLSFHVVRLLISCCFTSKFTPHLPTKEPERSLRAQIRKARHDRLEVTEEPLIVSDFEKEGTVSIHSEHSDSENSDTESETMAVAPSPVERLLGDYGGANAPFGRMTIVNQPVNVAHFQFHPSTIRQLERRPFSGKINEGANKHLQRFLTMTTSLKIEGHFEEAKKLVMFPFTLSEDAEEWFYSLPAGSITTWQQMETTFLNEYFPASNFVNGLRLKTKQLINTAAGGSTNFTTATGIKKIIEAIAANEHLELYDRSVSQPEGIIDLKLANQVVKMEDQIAAEVERRLKKMAIDTQTVAQVQQVQPTHTSNCEICGGPHLTVHCVATAQQIEEIKFLRQNNPYSNTYNPGWKNHPNFSWKDQQGNVKNQPQQQQFQPQQQQPYQQHQQQFQQQVPSKADWELAIEKMAAQSSQFQEETRSNLKNTSASIKNLEIQMSQIARQLAGSPQQGVLPSSTVTNPRENIHVNVVTTRNGKSKEIPEKSSEEEDLLLEVDLEIKENEVANEEVTHDERVVKDKVIDPKPSVKLPFPTRNKKKGQHEKNFEKFLEMFKKLELNIPFLEALEQMPTYAKFMKDIISKKRTIETNPIILTETCNAILQGMKVPVKKKDRGSLTIPCAIGDRSFKKALIDLGASVSLMPLSIYKRLGIGKIQDTRMTLQFADHSVKRPYGIVEDVLVKIDKFVFPVDFVILEMPEDEEIPIILGRPFLETGRCLIVIEEGTMTLKVYDEELKIDVRNTMKYKDEVATSQHIETIDQICEKKNCLTTQKLPLERVLSLSILTKRK